MVETLLFRIVEYGKVYTLDVVFDSLFVTGIYEMDGQILVLPIKGSGNFSANFSKQISNLSRLTSNLTSTF